MVCSKYVRGLLLVALMALSGSSAQFTLYAQGSSQVKTTVSLRWGARPGVFRYRLQLANDSSFRDIVFDRVINGNEATVNDLPPGRYFWRIAALTNTLGDFSSAGVVEVTAQRENVGPQPPINPSSIKASGGWRAVVGYIAQPVLAHLRSPEKFDVVGTNSDGVTYALDAMTGVALWSIRPRMISRSASPPPPIIVSSRRRTDDVILFSGATMSGVDGATGRELWQIDLPFVVAYGIAESFSNLVLVDSSLQRLLIVDARDGRVVTQLNLPGRVIGAPSALPNQNDFALAYDTGRVEIRDLSGALMKSGDAGSAATTAPLFLRTATANLVLVGTRGGLTALNADDLRPLGRVALNNDAPRGVLSAQDLDGDGNPEVIMTTARGHVLAVTAANGRILWDVAADADGGAFAFADVNKDHTPDIFVTGNQLFITALSGRDGATIWKDASAATPIANHAKLGASRSVVAIPLGASALVIASDSSRTGLRAISFSR